MLKKIGLISLLIFCLIFSNLVFALDAICLNNNTLQYNRTYLICTNINPNGNWTNITEYEPCPYGCDNITFTCNPSTYQANIYNIGIVIVTIIAMVLIYKFGRSKK